MNIKKYATYFHDGTISNIIISNDTLIFTMRSASLEEGENEDKKPLGKYKTICGKLHLFGVRDFKINLKHANLTELCYDYAEILELEFNTNLVFLTVIWLFDDKPKIYQELEFSVENYFFENIPKLVFPGDENFDENGKYLGTRNEH